MPKILVKASMQNNDPWPHSAFYSGGAEQLLSVQTQLRIIFITDSSFSYLAVSQVSFQIHRRCDSSAKGAFVMFKH